MTVATGMLSDRDAERAGLVPTHAYAMLDVRQTQVGRPHTGWSWTTHGLVVDHTQVVNSESPHIIRTRSNY